MAELREYAETVGASWIETSAKDNINVCSYQFNFFFIFLKTEYIISTTANVFDLVIGEIEKRAPHNQGKPPPTSGCVIM